MFSKASSPKGTRYFLIGYYGFGNAGDELCLRASEALLSHVDSGSDFEILSREKQGVNQVHRTDYRAVISAIRRCDVLVFGGGTLLQNTTSNRSLLYYLALLLIGRLFKKKTVFLGQGIGPINGSFFKWLTCTLLKSVDVASLRDGQSKSFFTERTTVYEGSDLSFLGKPTECYLESEPLKMALSVKPTVEMPLLKALIKKVKQIDSDPLGLCFYPEQDSAVFDDMNLKTVSIIGSETYYDKAERECSFMIAMRYHACVWAAMHGIPFFALAYDPKVKALADSLSQPCIPLYEKRAGNLLDSAEKLLELSLKTRNELRETLIANRVGLIKQASVHKLVIDLAKESQ